MQALRPLVRVVRFATLLLTVHDIDARGALTLVACAIGIFSVVRRVLSHRLAVKALTLGTIILSAVAAAAGAVACTTCPSTETIRSDEKDVETRRACNAMENRASTCATLCDSTYNSCFVDGTYQSTWIAAQGSFDAGAGDAARPCPPPSDGRAVVKVHCRETEPSEDLKFGGGCVIEGRRPACLLPPMESEDVSSLGAYFASVAYLEAAAVLAFERMIEELEAHRAPAELIEEARRARKDEVRHARATAKLARRFGAVPSPASCARGPVRDLRSIAIENEVEGVVRETLGAAIATWRAENAKDADIRAVMHVVAQDERRHAELSWRLGQWIRTQLDRDDRAALDAVRRAAIEELRTTFTGAPSSEVEEVAGAPNGRIVQRLVDELEREIWAARQRYVKTTEEVRAA